MITDLCVVIVVYNQNYSDTTTFKSLENLFLEKLPINFHVIIYDNSSDLCSDIPIHPFKYFEYVHDEHNMGVVPGYIYAKNYCISHNIKWLLRLDQDSCFDSSILIDFLKLSDVDTIKVIVPKIICKGKIISPSYVHSGAFYTNYNIHSHGLNDKKITFINSMSFINVKDKFICSILDSLQFMLDLSDHEFSYQLTKGTIYVLDNIVKHSLSIMDSAYVSLKRYEKIISNETLFCRKYEKKMGRIVFITRLLVRAIKFSIHGKLEYAKLTFRYLIEC